MNHTSSIISCPSMIIMYIRSHQPYVSYEMHLNGQYLIPTHGYFCTSIHRRYSYYKVKWKQVNIYECLLGIPQTSKSVFYSFSKLVLGTYHFSSSLRICLAWIQFSFHRKWFLWYQFSSSQKNYWIMIQHFFFPRNCLRDINSLCLDKILSIDTTL